MRYWFATSGLWAIFTVVNAAQHDRDWVFCGLISLLALNLALVEIRLRRALSSK